MGCNGTILIPLGTDGYDGTPWQISADSNRFYAMHLATSALPAGSHFCVTHKYTIIVVHNKRKKLLCT